jgi:hypothetical protein
MRRLRCGSEERRATPHRVGHRPRRRRRARGLVSPLRRRRRPATRALRRTGPQRHEAHATGRSGRAGTGAKSQRHAHARCPVRLDRVSSFLRSDLRHLAPLEQADPTISSTRDEDSARGSRPRAWGCRTFGFAWKTADSGGRPGSRRTSASGSDGCSVRRDSVLSRAREPLYGCHPPRRGTTTPLPDRTGALKRARAWAFWSPRPGLGSLYGGS